MKRHFTTITLLAIWVAIFGFGPVDAQQGNASGKFRDKGGRGIPDQYIVVLDESASGDYAEVLGRVQAVLQGRNALPEHVYAHAMKGFSARMTRAEALALSQDPRVLYVEEDGEMVAIATQTNATWGLDRVDQRDLPLSSSYTYPNDGAGVTAYVIDSGILAEHTDFGGRVRSGYTAISDGRGTSDCNGHGTHVTGTVAGARAGAAKAVRPVAEATRFSAARPSMTMAVEDRARPRPMTRPCVAGRTRLAAAPITAAASATCRPPRPKTSRRMVIRRAGESSRPMTKSRKTTPSSATARICSPSVMPWKTGPMTMPAAR